MPVHFALQVRHCCLCIAPINRIIATIKGTAPAMRAETQNIVDEIKQAISLLRRHL